MPPVKGKKYKAREPKPSPDLLDALWVQENPTAPTVSPTRQKLQELFTNDFERFVAMKHKFEAQVRGQASVEHPQSTDRDEGSERVEDLIEKMLAELDQP